MKVVVVGGTHGNELSGIQLLKNWQASPQQLARPGLSVSTLMGNPSAYRANRRYLDVDLNRQFLPERLADDALANIEQSRAKVINAQIGPKGASQTDLVIDLHNTTSNMGPTLILLDTTPWDYQLAAYVKQHMPEAVILVEDAKPAAEWGYLCTVGKRGVMVEVGPQSQSVLRHDILEQMATMTGLILDFASLEQAGDLPELPGEVEAYRFIDTHYLPMDEQGEPLAMVHKSLEQNDFCELKPGDPAYQYFDGRIGVFDGDRPLHPHFINEAAYYDSHAAFSLAERVTLNVPAR
ncbi:aspartoacylase [Ferrimonas balearica]|uniref:aspartoacylase n=1 Tax=Ferrimonas balearica TaxID=44012 RepID=UPI001C5AA0CF|nr:aspartoacylase [Ferrimonas balearica]MBW3166526.1 aspartoacylase [Ferrimonas balearica]